MFTTSLVLKHLETFVAYHIISILLFLIFCHVSTVKVKANKIELLSVKSVVHCWTVSWMVQWLVYSLDGDQIMLVAMVLFGDHWLFVVLVAG